MAYFTYLNKQIFYEDQGVGEPILFLNGIMMSTKSWEPFVTSMTKNNRFLRLDFFDMGQSARMDEFYTQALQVEVIKALLDHLRLSKINIMGISYGGEVAIQFALKYQKHLRRLMLFNTTSRTNGYEILVVDGIKLRICKESIQHYNSRYLFFKFYTENIGGWKIERNY